MKEKIIIFLILNLIFGNLIKPASGQTYCNPINLNYPFYQENPTIPDISDPTVVLYKDSYFLFASNAGGYWSSNDLLSWKYIPVSRLPLKNEVPTAAVIGNWLYFFNPEGDTIFRSKDPENRKWEAYTTSILIPEITDFAIFTDTDGKVYSYYGCTNNDGVMSRELDPNDFLKPIKTPVVCQKIGLTKSVRKMPEKKPVKIGSTYVQGSWMNKYNGKYYYQCTERNAGLKNSGDFVYVSDHPQGPFKYAANNPFSYKPNGFLCSVGSGSTFEDKYGNWWHIATVAASENHASKSSLALFPAGFDKDGNLFVKSDFGDYPIVLPNKKNQNIDKLDPGWSLLSDHIVPTASSDQAISTVAFACDENIGTFWSARTGKKGEWLNVDLGSVCTVNAFQINFAQHKPQSIAYDSIYANQYLVEYSIDDKNWKKLSNHTSDTEFRPNIYEELKVPVQARQLKITNYGLPAGNFAISEFRIFGAGTKRKPKKVTEFRAVRDYHNPQIVKLFWKKQANTTGYNIRFGVDKDKLYHSYQVNNVTRLTVPCPDKNGTYWFEIDAFNENGVSPGKPQMIR
ncbi:MAG: discoidin domain-containing protein [Prolixibacteraceae bacterium]|jgi:hypothetical protein